jgi:hypothetical protein
MTLNPVAGVTARRNVAERINRFLNGLQGVPRLPNRRELFRLREALVNLEAGQYPAGEGAMDKAERMLAIPDHAATDSRRDRPREMCNPYTYKLSLDEGPHGA